MEPGCLGVLTVAFCPPLSTAPVTFGRCNVSLLLAGRNVLTPAFRDEAAFEKGSRVRVSALAGLGLMCLESSQEPSAKVQQVQCQ